MRMRRGARCFDRGTSERPRLKRGLRVAIGGLTHETNQYVNASTVLADFDVTRGDAIFSGRMAVARTCLGGMLDAARELDACPIGTLYATAEPWGTIDAEAYHALKQELVGRIGACLPLDAVALDLHGAGVAEGCDDIEGDVCAAVRDVMGAEAIFVVTHDLHGHITRAEADVVDAMFAVHEYPHDDMYERGREAIEWIGAQLGNGRRPAIHVERLPMLVPMTTTYHGVGRTALDICLTLEGDGDVVDVAFMHGFPYTDNPLVGAQVVSVVDGSSSRAVEVAREAARAIWALREDFLVSYPGPEEAIAQALAHPGAPVVVNETSDNPGCGAPGDGTHLLRALLDARPAGAVYCGIRDADVVRQAHEAGVGATIEITLGGKTDELHGAPIRCGAYVKALTDGETVVEAPVGRGWRLPLGRTALLLVGNVEVIVFSRNVQTLDRTPLILHGIDPLHRKLVAIKSSQHFRSGFEELAEAIIPTDPPGLTTARLETLSRTQSPRPIFPLDPDVTYEPGATRPADSGS